jgi:hypothetical protein
MQFCHCDHVALMPTEPPTTTSILRPDRTVNCGLHFPHRLVSRQTTRLRKYCAPKATRDAIFRQTIKSLHRIYEKASTFIAGKKGFTKQYTIALLHHLQNRANFHLFSLSEGELWVFCWFSKAKKSTFAEIAQWESQQTHILIPSLAILVIRKEAHVQNFPASENKTSLKEFMAIIKI